MLDGSGEFLSLKKHPVIHLTRVDANDEPLVKQKINAILRYKNSNLIIACLSYGYVAVIDFLGSQNQPFKSKLKLHKGNITSACFVNDSEFLVTASGSFSKNHDNSIIVSKVSLAMNGLYFKKINTFSSAHGK